jgi:hypothetical protein
MDAKLEKAAKSSLVALGLDPAGSRDRGLGGQRDLV